MTRVLLLHGFTGAPRSYRELIAWLPKATQIWLPVLTGHSGQPLRGAALDVRKALLSNTDLSAPVLPPPGLAFVDEVDRLASWAQAEQFHDGIVVGYSLGGRLALGLLARHGTLFRRAVLVGTHPGLQTRQARAERERLDSERMEVLRSQPLSRFVQTWESLELFQTQQSIATELLAEQRAVRSSHTAEGLAASLASCGLAKMPDYRPELSTIAQRVDVVVGERDSKFRPLAEELCAGLPDGHLSVVPGCGHNVALERPKVVAEMICPSEADNEP